MNTLQQQSHFVFFLTEISFSVTWNLDSDPSDILTAHEKKNFNYRRYSYNLLHLLGDFALDCSNEFNLLVAKRCL